MSVASIIREKLAEVYGEGKANAANIFKGYEVSTRQNGWHFIPFNGTAVFLGKNQGEAIETIEQIEESREM